MNRTIVLVAGCLMMAASVAAEETTGAAASSLGSTKEQRAVAAAERWLALVDAGHYGQAWDEAASYFKGAVTKDQWTGSLNGVRAPLGRVISRQEQSARLSTELPGAPDGEYVVIEFQTNFANKSSGIETVTPVRETDGSWKVTGYYIR